MNRVSSGLFRAEPRGKVQTKRTYMEKTIPERNSIEQNDKWNLTLLYDSMQSWESDFARITEQVTKYESFRGKFTESASSMKDLLSFDLEISRIVENLYVYAHLKNDEDKSATEGQNLYQRAVTLYTKSAELSSFIIPEIQALSPEKAQQFLNDQLLAQHRFSLEKILRFKEHTLSQELEELIAMSGEVMGAPGQIFSQLDNADLRFGKIENGRKETLELSHGNFNTLLTDENRDTRKQAFFQYYEQYDAHKNTIAASLGYSIKKDRLNARVRKYPGCLDAALFSDRVPRSVYESLISAVRDNIPQVVEYMKIRKKALKLEDLHFYDTYVPMVSGVDFEMPYEEAVEGCCAALAPLGDEYVAILRNGLLNGWVDRYENRGKKSGAYSSGSYDSPPYILLNYEPRNINSLYTLIHEAGHSMHSYYSAKNQSYEYHSYTIFVAEVASTFNEVLLSEYLLKKYESDKKMSAYILNREIDNIRGTLFRQTMFAEFELRVHDMSERDEPLTVESLRTLYRALLNDYFSDSIVIDDVLELECLRIPHFYSAFYVYKYATGIAAAIALARKVLTDPSAKESYLKFLTLGGTMFPVDELRIAGVDMEKSSAVGDALLHFRNLLQRLGDKIS